MTMKALGVVAMMAISGTADAQLAPNGGAMIPTPQASQAGSSGFTPLNPANNLSDVASVPASRASLNIAFVSPLDYGAKCDGATNDSAAFQSALSSGKNVAVPAGVVCVAGNLTLGGSGQVFTTAGGTLTAAAGSSWVVKVSGFEPHMSGFYVNENGATASQTTLAAAASAGASSVTVASASAGPGVQAGQRYSILQTNGIFARGFVTSVSGTTVGLSEALPSGAAPGASFWSTFGAVYVTNAVGPVLDDIRCNAAYGCILVDDPNLPDTYAGVSKGSVTRIATTSGRMFGIVKGRNVSVMTFDNEQLWGGWRQSDSFAGDGATATFPLGNFVFLKRELSSVTVDGAAKTLGTDYTTNGFSITFATAPASGAAIAASYWTYGGDGYADDCEGVVASACGGNTIANTSSLQWDEPYSFQQAQLYTGSNLVADSGAEACVLFDGTTQTGKFWGLDLHWCPTQILARNSAAGAAILTAGSTLMPSSYPASGAAGVLSSIGTGSSVDTDWLASSTGATYSAINGFQTLYGLSSGKPAVGWGCAPGAALSNIFQWCGSSGAVTLAGSGAVLAFTYGGYNYVSADTANGVLVLQANGTNGVVTIDARANAKLNVNGVTDLNCGTAECAAAVPVQLPSYTVSALPACGSTVFAGAIAYVTDANAPSWNNALAGGGATQTLALCNGANHWTAH